MPSDVEHAVETLLCVLPRRALGDVAEEMPEAGNLTLTQVENHLDRDDMRAALRSVLEQGKHLEDLHGENNPLLPFVRDVVRSLLGSRCAPQAPADGAVHAR